MRPLTARALALTLAGLAVAGCTRSRPADSAPSGVTAPAGGASGASSATSVDPRVEPPTTIPPATLRPDELVELVPGADDVPAGMQLYGPASGPAGVDEIASHSDDPERMEHEIKDHHLEAGYQAQYVDPTTGALVSVYVSRWASAADARAIHALEVAETDAVADRFEVTGLGDEAAGFRQSVPEGDISHLVTLRVRLGTITWTVQAGGTDRADEAFARQLAETLVGRAA
jgi:hypothetical protein